MSHPRSALGWVCLLPAAAVGAAAAEGRLWEVAAEVAASSDVTLWQTSAATKFSRGPTQYGASIAGGGSIIDYRPVAFDFQGRAATLRRETVSAQGTVRHAASGSLTLLGGAGFHDGFTNYRSAWLAEYYRQQYSALTFLRGYREVRPRGLNASAALRWEYLPASGFAQFGFSWLGDRVAPGYEIDFDGLRRGADTLHTTALEAVFENVATPRLRTRLSLRAGRTSEREPRFAAEIAAHYALGERWALRGGVEGTRERPAFRARSAHLALEREIGSAWFLALTGRAYRDTGEIENALLFTSAAPGLRTRQFGLSLRFQGERVTWRVAFAPLRARSAPTNRATDFFQHLYRDRDWTVVQSALSAAF